MLRFFSLMSVFNYRTHPHHIKKTMQGDISQPIRNLPSADSGSSQTGLNITSAGSEFIRKSRPLESSNTSVINSTTVRSRNLVSGNNESGTLRPIDRNGPFIEITLKDAKASETSICGEAFTSSGTLTCSGTITNRFNVSIGGLKMFAYLVRTAGHCLVDKTPNKINGQPIWTLPNPVGTVTFYMNADRPDLTATLDDGKFLALSIKNGMY